MICLFCIELKAKNHHITKRGTKMKINRRGYETLLSADEKTLYLVGSAVSVWDISGEKAVELKRFNDLKNPDNIAVSTDGRLIAYSNTLGHIAVHDLESGELLVKSKCTSREGNGLYFIRDNRLILSSDWDGNVFTLNIETGEFTVTGKLPVILPDLCRVDDSTFLVIGSKIEDYSRLLEISVGEEIIWNAPIVISSYEADSYGKAVLGEKVFFCADAVEGDLHGRNSHTVSFNILSFDMTTKKLSVCLELGELFGPQHRLIYEHGYTTCMCIGRDGKTLLLGTNKEIIGIDLAEKKLLGIGEVKYLSSLHFMASDTKVLIGTWEHVEIVNFDSLFQP